ncbi:MAG TPA: 4-hydroxythreonine-4-phosphate dehydrogenase PdxA [Rhizomicrobium sp.]|nr:4-hydroxythreonine-4-phosphate dehydrogenase PdxA [Rhizomicrobium sp.]
MSRHAKPAPDAPIHITMGEPAGIGPEVAMLAFDSLKGRAGNHPLRLVGDPDVFRVCGKIDLASVIPVAEQATRKAGTPDPANNAAVIASIDRCVRAAMHGEIAAMVTAPISKAVLMRGGFPYSGHTEYLAHLTGASRAIMMLAAPALRVVPLTIHTPLSEVPKLISTDAIIEAGEIILNSLKRDFAVKKPRLAVAGLNPHAGESGTLGNEDHDIIMPAVNALRMKGHIVAGPLPADTMFHGEARARYDAALCMYHDQALIPIKTLAFWEAVNVTLGLPIVRTSPDHGTALDIAGKGKADPRSMIAAIELAAQMADARG